MSILEPSAKLAVRNIDDLVGLVPYLIGFHPADSLVVLVISAGRVQVTARVDLSAARQPGGVAALLSRLCQRFPTAECWFVAYADRAKPAWDVLEVCGESVGTDRLGRLVAVVGDSWRCDHRRGPTSVVSTSAMVAEAAVLGLQARSCRQELAGQIAGPTDAETGALLAEFEAAVTEISELDECQRRALLAALSSGADTPGDFVRLAVLVAEPNAQLAVVADLSAEDAPAAVVLWSAVVQHCLVRYLVGPLGVLGLASWLTGDGALQTICLERLDQLEPLAPVAALLDWINTEVLPPADWPRFRKALVTSLAQGFELLGCEVIMPKW